MARERPLIERERSPKGLGPSFERYPSVPHYWGDITRQIMLAGTALLLVFAPFYSASLRTELPLEVIGAILIILLAALTNPFSRVTILADAVLTGAAFAVYQTWAFWQYGQSTDLVFAMREAVAIAFLFAFYFSLKTYRAMILHQVGKPDSMTEFRREFSSDDPLDEEELEETRRFDTNPLAREEGIQEDDRAGD